MIKYYTHNFICVAPASSIDLSEDFALKCLLKDMKLAVMDLLGLMVASG